MGKIDFGINFIKKTSEFVQAGSGKSLLCNATQDLRNIDVSNLKLAQPLADDVVEFYGKPENLIEKILGKDLSVYLDKSADIGNPQEKLLSKTYAQLKTPEERALYRDVLSSKYPFKLQCEFFDKFYEPDISPKEQLEFIKKYINLAPTYLQKRTIKKLQNGDVRDAFFDVSNAFDKEKLLRFALNDKEYGLEYIDKIFHKILDKKPERIQELQKYSQIIDENLVKRGINLEKIENPVFSSRLEDLNPELYHDFSLYHGSHTASSDSSVRDAIAKYGFSQFSPGTYSSNCLFTTRNESLAQSFGGKNSGFLEFRLRKEVPLLSRGAVCSGIPFNAQDSEVFNSLLYEKGVAALNNPGAFSEIQIFDPKALTLIKR